MASMSGRMLASAGRGLSSLLLCFVARLKQPNNPISSLQPCQQNLPSFILPAVNPLRNTMLCVDVTPLQMGLEVQLLPPPQVEHELELPSRGKHSRRVLATCEVWCQPIGEYLFLSCHTKAFFTECRLDFLNSHQHNCIYAHSCPFLLTSWLIPTACCTRSRRCQ